MTIKLKVLCVVSALSFLASTACFSAYAAELLDRRSGDEEPYVSTEPTPEPPVQPDPIVSYEPDPIVSYEPDPIVSYEPDPVVSTPESTIEPGSEGDDPNEPGENSSEITYSDLITESNFPQGGVSGESQNTVSNYNDYNQNNNYVNPYSTVYDDNYVYVPSYTEPEQDLIDTSSKVINTDELTKDDWAKIMLDLEKGNVTDDGTKTFNFIKENDEVADTSIAWMLYLGMGLILLSIFTVIYVIISTNVTIRKNKRMA